MNLSACGLQGDPVDLSVPYPFAFSVDLPVWNSSCVEYYLIGEKAALISVADDIRILSYEKARGD
jgi:hypothetical protein